MVESDKLTEEKIFDAATEVFIEKGMDGARMQDIATRAGINKALLHYYFRTKEHLFNAVFEKISSQLFVKLAPLFDEKLSLDQKIRFFFREHITLLQNNPGLPAFILNEVRRNPQTIRKILKNIDFKKFWVILYEQHKDEFAKYNISENSLPQIMTSIVAISVFPFAARGIIEGILDNMGIDFNRYIEERKEFAADFVIKALKK